MKGDFEMKKVIVFMLSVLIIFSLAACGSQDGGNQGSAPQSANEGSGTENLQNPSGQIEAPVKDADGSSTETSAESVELGRWTDLLRTMISREKR